MTKLINTQDNKDQIQQLLEQWADAIKKNRVDEILSNHASNVVIFDVLPPLRYDGAAAYRKSWGEWQPETVGEGLFDLHELQITAGEDVGFAHAFIHCLGTRPDGTTFEDLVRATFCLCKIDSRWQITHQHVSMPVGTMPEGTNAKGT